MTKKVNKFESNDAAAGDNSQVNRLAMQVGWVEIMREKTVKIK